MSRNNNLYTFDTDYQRNFSDLIKEFESNLTLNEEIISVTMVKNSLLIVTKILKPGMRNLLKEERKLL